MEIYFNAKKNNINSWIFHKFLLKDIAHNENMDHNKFLSLVICNGLVQVIFIKNLQSTQKCRPFYKLTNFRSVFYGSSTLFWVGSLTHFLQVCTCIHLSISILSISELVYLVNGFWLVCMLFCDTENDKLASFYFIILGYGASQAMWKYIFLGNQIQITLSVSIMFWGCFCGLDRSGMRYLYIYPVCRVFGWIFGLLLDIGLQEYKIKNVIMPIIFATIMIPHIKFL